MKYWISRYFKVPLGTQVLLEDPYVLKYSYEYVKVQVQVSFFFFFKEADVIYYKSFSIFFLVVPRYSDTTKFSTAVHVHVHVPYQVLVPIDRYMYSCK